MNPTELIGFYQEQENQILQTIGEMVREETPSNDKERLDIFVERLADRFSGAGLETEIISSPTRGNHLRGLFENGRFVENPDAAPALILCHYDTVWPVGSLATHPFRVDDQGWAYGPGIFDMQSSLALAETVLRGIQSLGLRLPRPVTLLATSDEEVGSLTSRELIEEEASRSAYVLVLEPPLPGGKLKTTRKGGSHFSLEIKGRAAHAGVEPEKGISAVQEMAHQILALHELTDLEAGTTVNVGVVTAGTRPNVVAAHAEAHIDVRAWTAEEMRRVSEAIMDLQPNLSGTELVVTGGENRPPLERSVTGGLFEQARRIARPLGIDLQEAGTGGGSDGNLTGAMGVPTLDGLGIPGDGAHADNEHIEVDKIAERAAILTLLLQELSP